MDNEVKKYPSILEYNKVKEFFNGHLVVVQEKLNGGNVSIIKDIDGNISYQSRRLKIDPNNPIRFFNRFMQWALSEKVQNFIKSVSGPIAIYGKTLNIDKLKYQQYEPFVLFEVLVDDIYVVNPDKLKLYGEILGCPVAPILYHGMYDNMPEISTFIGKSSFDSRDDFLMEGVVVKSYYCDRWYYVDGEKRTVFEPMIAGKYVRDQFKETKPEKKEFVDPLDAIAEMFFTPARYDKAEQAVLEQGGDLSIPDHVMREVMTDIFHEEGDAIKEALYKAYSKSISSRIQKMALKEYRDRNEL